MHELSIAHAIVATVTEAVPADASVEVVRVRVGSMSGIVGTALEYAWDMAAMGTKLDGSRLEVESVPVTVRCYTCEDVVTPEVGVRCPRCDTPALELLTGKELEIVNVDLAEEATFS